VNGYVEAGYSVVLATLAIYAARLAMRRRALQRAAPQPHRPAPDPPGAGGTRGRPGGEAQR
jgi:hypothetical protein